MSKTNTATKSSKYEMDMTTGKLLPKILVFALPLMASSLLQLLFNAADTIVVGRFAGDEALAAVGSTASLVNLLVNLFIGLSVGTNVLVARYYAAKQERELSETIHTSILLAIVSGIILIFIGVVGARTFLTWMGSHKDVIGLSTIYVRIYFCGMPTLLLYNFGAAILRAVGDTKRPLYYLMAAGILNVILNLFFVIVLHMSVAGVALATILSQLVSAGLVLRCLMKNQGLIRVELKKLHIHKDKMLQIFRIGLPASFQGMLFSFSNVIIQSSINSFGKIVMAGSAAGASIEGFVWVAMNSFHQASVTFTSQNVGAGKKERIIPITIRTQICVIVTGILLGQLAYLFGNQLLSLYTQTADSIAAGMIRLKIICGTYALCGMMDVMVGSLRGLGYSISPMIISLVGACGLRLLWIFTFFRMDRFHTIESLYWTYPVTWGITFLAQFILFLFAYHRYKKNS